MGCSTLEGTTANADHLEARDPGRGCAAETPRWLPLEAAVMVDDVDDADESDDPSRPLECDLCGETVPAAVYREHLLKSCPGR